MTLVQTEPKKIYIWVDVTPITTAWIYWNETAGLISLSSDGSNWLTIADKNLGATTSDVTSTASYWDYYSRWAKQNRNWQSASWYTMKEDRSLWNQSISPSWCHIPTQAEWTSLVSTLSSILWVSSLNYNYAMKYLLLPRSWQMLDSWTTIQYAETAWWGYYWSSTKSSSTAAYILRSQASLLNATWNAITFPRWFPIRVFKDVAVQPREWTERDGTFRLKSYEELRAITYWVDVLAELNTSPLDYYNKLNSEWHLLNTSPWLYFIAATPTSSGDTRPYSSSSTWPVGIYYNQPNNQWEYF